MMCQDLKWLSEMDYQVEEETDEYDKNQSIDFIAVDNSGDCIGTCRVILSGIVPLPIIKYFKISSREKLEKDYGSLQYCVEASRFIVPKNNFFNRHEITLALSREMINLGFHIGVTHVFLSLDYRFFRLLKILGFPINEIGETKLYMGSKTTPGVLALNNLLPELKVNKPSLYDYLAAEGDMVREKTLV